jgi:hypothetical protein
LSKTASLLFVTTSNSHLLIFITFRCVFAITCTFVDYCASTCTSMDRCASISMTFSSLVSFCVVYVSTKCYSTSLSSFDYSINTESTDVALSLVYSLAHQCLLFLHKNSTTCVLVVSISWIIICTNYIFSLYTFPSAHSEDDDECGGDLTTNG